MGAAPPTCHIFLLLVHVRAGKCNIRIWIILCELFNIFCDYLLVLYILGLYISFLKEVPLLFFCIPAVIRCCNVTFYSNVFVRVFCIKQDVRHLPRINYIISL